MKEELPLTPMAMEMREAELVKSVINKRLHWSLYDAWDDESPAAMNQQFSAELRELLRGGNAED